MLALGLFVLGAATAAAPTPAQASESLGLRATYDVSATLSYAAGTLDVRSTATVTNRTDVTVGELDFNLLPVKIGQLALGDVLVGGEPAAAETGAQTITVSLPSQLEPEQSVDVLISYKAKLRTNTKDKNWMFAKLNGVVTAYRWIPWLSRKVKFARPNFGDPFVTGVSPEVRVKLTSDRSLVYATSGRRTSVSGTTQTFVAEKVRDFNFSASPRYKVYKGKAGGVKIRIYYTSLSPTKLFKWAKRSINRFSRQVGPYPYPFYVVAQTEGGTGMESPAMTWIPRSTKSSNLAYLVAHETAHQWFYAIIGNDQAREPYADEAPADFLARDLLVSRRKSKCSVDRLDRTVYDYSSSCYYEVVYIQGGNYLADYRLLVGEQAFWTGMRAYYDEYAFKIGGTFELLAALDQAAGEGLGGGHAERFPRLF